MAEQLLRTPGGLGFKPRPSRYFLRQGTLLHFASMSSPRCLNGYQRHSAGGG